MSPTGKLGIFYQNDKVQTLLQADHATTVVNTPQTVLAQCSANAHQAATMLLGTDQQASPISESDLNERRAAGYTPYGLESALQGCVGFTGQLRAGGLQGYLLGNGYRFYDPMLMRFHSPDALSPFSIGGLNCYAYCGGDPVNFSDPTGHMERVPMASHTSRSRSRSPQHFSDPTGRMRGIKRPASPENRPLSPVSQQEFDQQRKADALLLDELGPRPESPPEPLSQRASPPAQNAPSVQRLASAQPLTVGAVGGELRSRAKPAPVTPREATLLHMRISERTTPLANTNLQTTQAALSATVLARMSVRGNVREILRSEFGLDDAQVNLMNTTVLTELKSIRGKK